METFDLVLHCIKNHISLWHTSVAIVSRKIAIEFPAVTLGNVYISIKIHEEETGCTPT